MEEGSEKEIELQIEKNELLKELEDADLQRTKDKIDAKVKSTGRRVTRKNSMKRRKTEQELIKLGEQTAEITSKTTQSTPQKNVLRLYRMR